MKEIWKDVRGYEGLYQVSDCGNVKALAIRKKRGQYFQLRSEIILKPSIKKRGYRQVTLHNTKGEKRYIMVHQLVALTFIPNPENKPTINHKDGNTVNNLKDNLEWATHKEQVEHADRVGLRDVKGENSNRSKLTNEQVLEIRRSNLSGRELAIRNGVYFTTISKIKNRASWKHI